MQPFSQDLLNTHHEMQVSVHQVSRRSATIVFGAAMVGGIPSNDKTLPAVNSDFDGPATAVSSAHPRPVHMNDGKLDDKGTLVGVDHSLPEDKFR